VLLSLRQTFMHGQKTNPRLIRKRRVLTVEPLESRSLLAGDLLGVAAISTLTGSTRSDV
jgi:hypothetical protein